MKLYSSTKKERPPGGRGVTWRSEEIYQCKICHTKSNEWIYGGYPGYGPRMICPGDLYKEHDDLEEVLKKYNNLGEEIKEYEQILPDAKATTKEKAENMIQEMKLKQSLLEIKLNKLRDLFKEKVDDVQGVGINAKIIDYYPFARYLTRSRSILDV